VNDVLLPVMQITAEIGRPAPLVLRAEGSLVPLLGAALREVSPAWRTKGLGVLRAGMDFESAQQLADLMADQGQQAVASQLRQAVRRTLPSVLITRFIAGERLDALAEDLGLSGEQAEELLRAGLRDCL
jgi:hypothetical protein